MDRSQKIRNGVVNTSFKKNDIVTYQGADYKFIEYLDYGFTCTIRNCKTGKVKHIFAYDDDIKLKSKLKRPTAKNFPSEGK